MNLAPTEANLEPLYEAGLIPDRQLKTAPTAHHGAQYRIVWHVVSPSGRSACGRQQSLITDPKRLPRTALFLCPACVSKSDSRWTSAAVAAVNALLAP